MKTFNIINIIFIRVVNPDGSEIMAFHVIHHLFFNRPKKSLFTHSCSEDIIYSVKMFENHNDLYAVLPT